MIEVIHTTYLNIFLYFNVFMEKLSDREINNFLNELGSWKLVDGRFEKEFEMKNFVSALDFVNRVGIIAESEHHYPDILISYANVKISLFSYGEEGLTVKDMILAERINEMGIAGLGRY
jgi:4a-hydroxytetrahydrobiopterin dehydratase